MRCPNCQRENAPSSQFCVFCGNRLPVAQSPPNSLEQEVKRLGQMLEQISGRLAALEQAQGIVPLPLPAEVAAAAPETPPPTPRVEVREPTPAPTPAAPPVPREPREWEQILGGNWLARIGVLALLFGVGFFLKFAFDHNWIGPGVRIIMGLVAGLLMIGGEHLWRSKYPIMTRALTGGGVGIMYLSIFAASSSFDLIRFIPAVILMLLVCGGSVFFALRYNSMSLAILGIIGAFIAPMILGPFTRGVSPAGGVSLGIELLTYIAIVDVGVLAVSTFRAWRWFTLIAFVFSVILYSVWFASFGRNASDMTAFAGLTALFLIFVAATMLFHLVWRKVPQPFDFVLMVLNALTYTGIGLGLLWTDFRVWTGGFVLVLSVFYTGLAYVSIKRNPFSPILALFSFGIAIVFLAIAIPVQFGDQAATTAAWAAMGVALVWLSRRPFLGVLRGFAYGVFAVMTIRLFFFDAPLGFRDYTPILNERVLAFVFGIAAMYLSAWLLARGKATVGEGERSAAVPAFAIAANVLTIVVLSVELFAIFEDRLRELPGRFGRDGDALRDARNLSMTGLWALYAVGLLVVGIWRRIRFVRLGALALLAIAIGKVFFYDVWLLQAVYRIIAFIGLGILLLVAAFLYQRYARNIRNFLVKG